MNMNEFRELDERLAKAQELMADIDQIVQFLKTQNVDRDPQAGP